MVNDFLHFRSYEHNTDKAPLFHTPISSPILLHSSGEIHLVPVTSTEGVPK